jgi:hypothetical protein
MKVWRYVIVVDCGSAPNFGPPLTTLAICKPRIRKGAQPGDLVLGFAGKPIASDPHKVVWAGFVSEKLTFAQYWRDPRFRRKKPQATPHPDNIYRTGAVGLIQVPNSVHDAGSIATDERGRFVLVLNPAWHLDLRISSLPEQFSNLRLSPNNRRGHRVSDVPPHVAAELLAWLQSRADGDPRGGTSGLSCGSPAPLKRHMSCSGRKRRSPPRCA